MNLQSFLNSRQAGKLALRTSRLLPPGPGQRLASFLADRISSNNQLPLILALRANRWVISGGKLSASQLNEAARQNLRHIAHSYYTFFHNLSDPDALQSLVSFTPQIEELIARSQEGKEGVIVTGLHLSNFDLVFQAAARRGLRAVGLSLPEASEAIEWQHNFRRMAGLEILPASVENFRQVISRLKTGHVVVTGIDRPVNGTKAHHRFFGQPAHVPVHHIHLALKAEVPIVIMGAILCPDGIYHIHSSDYIDMRRFPNRQTEIMWNAERVLEIAADIIRQAPHQWAVMQPVWPEVLTEVPVEVENAGN
jgi:lauroyl/myristoyl acyltransferase